MAQGRATGESVGVIPRLPLEEELELLDEAGEVVQVYGAVAVEIASIRARQVGEQQDPDGKQQGQDEGSNAHVTALPVRQ